MPEYPQLVYDELGPAPPKPTAAEKANPDANRAKLEAWRTWNAQAQELIDNKRRRSGMTLAQMGMRDAPGQGQWLFDRDRMLSEYGGAVDARWIYDWVHGTKHKRAGLDQSEGVIPISPEEYAGRNQMERWRGKNPGHGFEDYLRSQGIRQGLHPTGPDMTTGHFFKLPDGSILDPYRGVFDKYGNQIGDSGMATQLAQQYGYPISGPPSGGGGFGSNSPFSLPEGYSFPSVFDPAKVDQYGGWSVIQQLLQQAQMFGGGNAQFQRALTNLIQGGSSPPLLASGATNPATPSSIGTPPTVATPPAVGNRIIPSVNINPPITSQPNSPFSSNITGPPQTRGFVGPSNQYTSPQSSQSRYTGTTSPWAPQRDTSTRRPFTPGRLG